MSDTKDDYLMISAKDYKELNDKSYSTHLKNEELHEIIKHILNIEDKFNYMPDVYKKLYNDMLNSEMEDTKDG